jgi:nucleotide-binding universal stress UspA family protein
MYRHILIPTDGSELAERGVTSGLALAKSLGAKVSVIVVMEPSASQQHLSALGQKQTFAPQNGMFALPPKATLNAFSRMSAKGQ